jgi:uncharacterized protein
MAGEVNHFEIPAPDIERTKSFWTALLGWSFRRWEGDSEYWLIDGAGVPGGVYPSGEDRGVVVSFRVDGLDDSLARLRELGGSVAGQKRAIPGVGWFARCDDPDGNHFGLFESDESAS